MSVHVCVLTYGCGLWVVRHICLCMCALVLVHIIYKYVYIVLFGAALFGDVVKLCNPMS